MRWPGGRLIRSRPPRCSPPSPPSKRSPRRSEPGTEFRACGPCLRPANPRRRAGGWRPPADAPHRRRAISRGAMAGDTAMAAGRSRAEARGRDFIRDIIAEDLASGRHKQVVTRFPPEPNGYLHIGHAKAICLNFGVAEEFGGRCHLRFDDTNPVKEEREYIDAIMRDVRWLGFDWGPHLYHASDYFEQLYEWAEYLIRAGKAYVDDLSAEEIRRWRGTLTEPGRNSPYRERSVSENLDLFRRMRAGEFPDGARVLRAKIDMAAANINLRDPVLYRILHAAHPRTGTKWCIYPTYDFAHGQSDAIEGVTHSLCTLEFEDHRPLYDWLLDNLPVPARPGGDFARQVGGGRGVSLVDLAVFEHAVREHLNKVAARRMAVLRPLKLVIENYPEGGGEELVALNNPEDPAAGTRRVPFGRELYIERDDFMEHPPKQFFRLAPGREVRLRYAYFVTCHRVVKNADGLVTELRCRYDPATRGGTAPDGRKVGATLHWVAAAHARPAEIRLYNPLFTCPDPGAAGDAFAALNPNSCEVLKDALVEPALAELAAGEVVQFERLGYFCRDPDGLPDRLVFNRTVGLRDGWKKAQAAAS